LADDRHFPNKAQSRITEEMTARKPPTATVSEYGTPVSHILIRLLADLDQAGVLATLPRRSRYHLRSQGNISLRTLITAVTECGHYLFPSPEQCIERLGGIRPAARKSGLSVNTIQSLQKHQSTLDSYLTLTTASKSRIKLQKVNLRAALWTAKENCWTTPASLLEQLYPLLPALKFDVDPCSPCQGSTAPVRAYLHYTKTHDGLARSWGRGTFCFVNPPFSELRQWIQKALKESENGAMSILLCPARVDAVWWHTMVAGRIPTVILRGRLHFGGGDRQEQAPFASALLIIGAYPQFPMQVAKATGGWLTNTSS
jgi:phage N-6-adenine-methyltransferase